MAGWPTNPFVERRAGIIIEGRTVEGRNGSICTHLPFSQRRIYTDGHSLSGQAAAIYENAACCCFPRYRCMRLPEKTDPAHGYRFAIYKDMNIIALNSKV
jgi:hypothetical protein